MSTWRSECRKRKMHNMIRAMISVIELVPFRASKYVPWSCRQGCSENISQFGPPRQEFDAEATGLLQEVKDKFQPKDLSSIYLFYINRCLSCEWTMKYKDGPQVRYVCGPVSIWINQIQKMPFRFAKSGDHCWKLAIHETRRRWKGTVLEWCFMVQVASKRCGAVLHRCVNPRLWQGSEDCSH